MNDPIPAVELVEVWKQFDETTAVQGISLRIPQGEFFSLLGPSGCGKTTTLRMIAGFEQPSRGAIRLLGQEIQHQPPNRRNVNMVFQNYALFPHLSVYDNVAFGLQAKRYPRQEIPGRVAEALAMVRLSGLGPRKPAQLSGGQQQRVALARALVNRPAVLLLDEPLGALDQKLRKDMQLELKRLQREVGITFIYVTHDQEEALTMSDRIAVMNQGKVLQVAEPRQIYEVPGTRFVADFIGTTNFFPGKVVEPGSRWARVELDGLGLACTPVVEGLVPGQPITLAVRPERMKLVNQLVNQPVTRVVPEPDNTVEGVLDDILFVGSDLQYIIRLKNGAQVMVREPNQGPLHAEIPYHPGQTVLVTWSPDSTRVLME